MLNRNGLKTGYGKRWTRERVTSLRSSHHIPVFRDTSEGEELWLNLSQAAAVVGVAPRTLRLAAERGDVSLTIGIRIHKPSNGEATNVAAEISSAPSTPIAFAMLPHIQLPSAIPPVIAA